MNRKALATAVAVVVAGNASYAWSEGGFSKIAQSKKLGIEIRGKHLSGNSWCAENVQLQVRVDDPAVTENGSLAKLVKKLGPVLQKECSSVTTANLDVVKQQGGDALETGNANLASGWAYQAVKPAVEKPDAQQVAQLDKIAEPAEAKTAAPVTKPAVIKQAPVVADQPKPAKPVEVAKPEQPPVKADVEKAENVAKAANVEAPVSEPAKAETVAKTAPETVQPEVAKVAPKEKVKIETVSAPAKPEPEKAVAKAEPAAQPKVAEQPKTTPLADKTLEQIFAEVKPTLDAGSGGDFNMLGDWKVSYTCKGWNKPREYEYFLSIYQQNGDKYQAYIDWTKADGGIGGVFKGAGYYIASGNVLSFKSEETIQPGRLRSVRLQGRYDQKLKTFVGEADSNCSVKTITRISEQPTVAERISTGGALHETLQAWADARMVRGSEFGRLPKGEVSFPGCEKVLEWSQRYPLDISKTVLNGNFGKVHLHHLDDISAKYFGSPTYYWTQQDSAMLRKQLSRCDKAIGRDNRRHIERNLLNRNRSGDVALLQTRRQMDNKAIRFSMGLIQAGFSNEALYKDQKLRVVENNIRNSLGREYLATDIENVKQEAGMYLDFYAARVVNSYAKQIDGLKAQQDLVKAATELSAQVQAVEGSAKVTALKLQTVATIDKQVAEYIDAQMANRVKALQAPIDSLIAADLAKGENETLLASFGKYRTPAQEKQLSDELSKSLKASGSKILDVTLKEIAKADPDKLKSFAEVKRLLVALKAKEQEFGRYGLKAEQKELTEELADVRDELFDKSMEFFKKDITSIKPEKMLKRHPNEWERNFLNLNELPNKVQKDFGDYPVAARVKEELEDIKEGMLETLGEAAKAMVAQRHGTEGEMSPRDFTKLIEAANTPVHEFQHAELAKLNQIQKEHAVELMEKQLEKQEELAEQAVERAETYNASSRKSDIYRDWAQARHFAIGLKPLLKEHDDLEDLQEGWQEAQDVLQKVACATTHDLGGDAELKVLAGTETGLAPLGDLVCAMQVAGKDLVKFEKPGLFGGDNYVMTFQGKRDNVTITLKEVKNGSDEALLGFEMNAGDGTERLDREEWDMVTGMILLGAERKSDVPFNAKVSARGLGARMMRNLLGGF